MKRRILEVPCPACHAERCWEQPEDSLPGGFSRRRPMPFLWVPMLSPSVMLRATPQQATAGSHQSAWARHQLTLGQTGTRASSPDARECGPVLRRPREHPSMSCEGIITPADLHFERHHGGIPAIDPERYSLVIHGMVERPMTFTLRRSEAPPLGIPSLLSSSVLGNGGAAYNRSPRPEASPQQIDGLLSTSEWTGVALATLLA